MHCVKLSITAKLGAPNKAQSQTTSRVFHSSPLPGLTKPRGQPVRISADESAMISGEWPVSWSLASYEDLGDYFKNQFFKADTTKLIASVMSTNLITTTPDATLDSVAIKFERVSGLPVLDTEGRLVGVISKKDLDKPGRTVADVMNASPVAAQATAKVQDAAVLMLKHKIHRIPIVDNNAKCIGMISRTDVFTSLALETF